MEFEFIDEHPTFKFLNHTAFLSKAETLFRSESFTKKVYLSVVFMSDEDLLLINKQYLKHNYYTDIITFPIEEDEESLEAELYISIDRVRENSEKFNSSFEQELLRVFLHGILHLIGYNDKTEEEIKVMRAKEVHYLNA